MVTTPSSFPAWWAHPSAGLWTRAIEEKKRRQMCFLLISPLLIAPVLIKLLNTVAQWLNKTWTQLETFRVRTVWSVICDGVGSYTEGHRCGKGRCWENVSHTLRIEAIALLCLITNIWYSSSNTSVVFVFVMHDKRLKT